MKSSIQRKLSFLYIFAVGIVLLTGFVSFYYLYRLGNDVGGQISKDIQLIQNFEDIQEKIANVMEIGNELVYFPDDQRVQGIFIQETGDLKTHLKENSENALSSQNKERHYALIDLLNQYQNMIMAKGDEPRIEAKRVIRDIRKISDSLIQDRNVELSLHQQQIQMLLSNAQRNLILILIIVITGGVLISTIVPHRIAVPFRKFIYALQEVEGGNLNVRLPEKGEGEIVTMQKTFNETVKRLATIEEMRIRKINFEKRRFSALADMVDRAVLLVSVEGRFVHLNSQFYDVFHLTSDAIINRHIDEVPLPESFKELIYSILSKTEKFQNLEYKLAIKRKDGTILERNVWVDASPVKNHTGAIVNWIFSLEDKDTTSKHRLFAKA